jgi:hypothetical protein
LAVLGGKLMSRRANCAPPAITPCGKEPPHAKTQTKTQRAAYC